MSFVSLLLLACSNSTAPESTSIETTFFETEISPSEEKTDVIDSLPMREYFLPVAEGKLIPNANFNTPFTLKPPHTQHEGTVHCTFDGTEPDTTSPIFTENKKIDTTTVVRCYEFLNGSIKQKQTETYFINEFINMPVLSISVAPQYVEEYLDAKPCLPDPCSEAKFWEDIEYPTHVEYFSEGSISKNKDFEIDAGISIMGGYSRNQQKKSVSIVMRKEYQDGRLHYPLFDTRPENSKFKAFILRNNGNRFISDYIEDAMATSLLEGSNVDYQRSKQVVIFYNGLYHGIYDMREKLNEHFVETNYGINDKNVDFIKHSFKNTKVQNGSSTDYQNMLQYINSNNFKDNSFAYDSVLKLIDMANYTEYMAAEIYYHNGDWPQNNVRAWKNGNSPWKFVAYDIDHGFDWTWFVNGFTKETNMIEWIMNGGKKNGPCATNPNYLCFHTIFVKLLENEKFKQTMINRAAYMYSTFISGAKVSATIDKMTQSIDSKQISRDQALYPRRSYLNSCGKGFDKYGNCLKSWSEERDLSVRNEFRQAFNLGDDILITIQIKGKGRLKLDNIYTMQSDVYNWRVFENHPLQLNIECYAGENFLQWEDGSKNPERLIYPRQQYTYTAECR